jgi:hypothetical protein
MSLSTSALQNYFGGHSNLNGRRGNKNNIYKVEMPKVQFQWIPNTDRPAPLAALTERNYKSSLNKIASVVFTAEDQDFHLDTVEKLLDFPEEVITEIELLENRNQKVQAYSAVMYQLRIGKKKDGTFARLTPTTLKYYNAYQKTKVDSSGNPHSQKIFETYKEYLASFKIYKESLD